jgi:small conductance mechanosensitive channel
MSEAIDLVIQKLTGWLQQVILLLPNLVVATIVAVAFGLLSRVVRRLVTQGMNRVSSHRALNRLFATLASLVIAGIGVLLALTILDLSGVVTSVLAGVGILGLALGFAFQEIASNFVSGILLLLRRPFRESDIIKTNDFFGTVEEVNLRTTLIRVPEGQIVYVPNSHVLQNPLINYSSTGKRRVDLPVGVSYGDDLKKAKRVAIEAVTAMTERDTSRDVELFYESFGDSSINFTLRFWIDFAQQTDYLGARSEAVMRIKEAFDRNDITIPFPIRTLDFGIVGGEKLSEALPRHLFGNSG